MALSDKARELLQKAAEGHDNSGGLIEIYQVYFGDEASFNCEAGSLSISLGSSPHREYLEFQDVAMKLALAGFVSHEPGDSHLTRYRLTLKGYAAAEDPDYDFSGLDNA